MVTCTNFCSISGEPSGAENISHLSSLMRQPAEKGSSPPAPRARLKVTNIELVLA